MSKDIFISYSSKDTEITDKIHDYLENNGFSCWMAPKEIKTSENYSQKIIDALNSAKIVLLVFSEYSHASEYVTEEIDNAFTRGIPILPFRIDDTFPKGKMEFYLRHCQWLDASSNPEDHFPQLLEDVDRLCKEGKKPFVPPKPHEPHEIEPPEPPKRTSLYIAIAVIAIIAVVGGFMFLNGGGDSNADANETGIFIDFIQMDNDTGKGYSWKYSYFVFGTISPDLTNSSDNVVHVDFLDKSGKTVNSNDTKVGDIEGNTLASAYLDVDNVDKVSVELRDGDNKVLYSTESDNIKSVGG